MHSSARLSNAQDPPCTTTLASRLGFMPACQKTLASACGVLLCLTNPEQESTLVCTYTTHHFCHACPGSSNQQHIILVLRHLHASTTSPRCKPHGARASENESLPVRDETANHVRVSPMNGIAAPPWVTQTMSHISRKHSVCWDTFYLI